MIIPGHARLFKLLLSYPCLRHSTRQHLKAQGPRTEKFHDADSLMASYLFMGAALHCRHVANVLVVCWFEANQIQKEQVRQEPVGADPSIPVKLSPDRVEWGTGCHCQAEEHRQSERTEMHLYISVATCDAS
jgi:hypothetical protein